MRSTDRQTFDGLLDMLGRVFRVEITPDLRRDYWDALQTEHVESVIKFAHRCRDNGKHFPRPGELKPKVSTHEAAVTMDAQEAERERMRQQAMRMWDDVMQRSEALGKLRLADALMARYECEADQRSPELSEKKSWLRRRIGELVRECEAAAVFGDPALRARVFQQFGVAGYNRLRDKAEPQRQPEQAA